MAKRKEFTEEQKTARAQLIKDKYGRLVCECCEKGKQFSSLEGHHRNGDETDNSDKNLVLVCVPCHFHCCHDCDWVNYGKFPRTCKLGRCKCGDS